jgi:hypothetical protein
VSDQPGYFILKGCAGLGNRLITLSNTIRYCEENQRTLIVDWSEGMFAEKGRNIFPEYFQLTGLPFLESLDELGPTNELTFYPQVFKRHLRSSIYDLYSDSVPFPRFRRRVLKVLTAGRWTVSGTWVLRPEFQSEAGSCMVPIFGMIRSGRLLPMSSEYPSNLDEAIVVGADFLPPFAAELFRRSVSIRPDVELRLSRIAQEYGIGQKSLGIHIRQTDWSWKSDAAPLLNKLRALPSNTYDKVFLATDSMKVVERFEGEIPSLVVYPKFLPEPEKGGLHHWSYQKGDPKLAESMFEESLIDLYLLSRCGTFWMQGESSFSKIANAFAAREQHAVDWTQLAE